jgi:hypothetical protein
MDNRQKSLIEGLMANKVSHDDFRTQLPLYGDDKRNFLIDSIAHAKERNDGVELELALFTGFKFGLFTADVAPLLADVLQATWHTSHEDIAGILKDLRQPSSVEPLAQAIKSRFEYLDYNDSASFANKCLWALAAVNNTEAWQFIRETQKSDSRDDVRATADHLLQKLRAN